MAKERVAAEGMTIGYGTSSSGPFTLVGNVTSITPPGVTTQKVKRTHLASTIQENRASKIPEITDATFRIQLDPSDATDLDLIALAASGTETWWQISHEGDSGTTNAKDVFKGFVMEYKPASNEDAKDEEADFTIVPTSVITRTPKS